MRFALLIFYFAVCGCSVAARDAPIERVELRASGLNVIIKHDGKGRFEAGGPRVGRFDLGVGGFEHLRRSLAEFEKEAAPTDKTSRKFLETGCSKKLPQVTDAGMMSVRWVGTSLDIIYIADFGCDYRRFAERNLKLRNVLKSLPVPSPATLP